MQEDGDKPSREPPEAGGERAKHAAERARVVPARLLREPEEREEHERAERGAPARELDGGDRPVARGPLERRELVDLAEVEVDVGPDVRAERLLAVHDEHDERDGDGAEDLRARERHEAHVPARGHGLVAREELGELRLALEQRVEREHCAYVRNRLPVMLKKGSIPQ
jgi:hypothetical protein